VKVRRLIEKKVKTSFSTYREMILTGGFLGFAVDLKVTLWGQKAKGRPEGKGIF
jgi:hypothetical protein